MVGRPRSNPKLGCPPTANAATMCPASCARMLVPAPSTKRRQKCVGLGCVALSETACARAPDGASKRSAVRPAVGMEGRIGEGNRALSCELWVVRVVVSTKIEHAVGSQPTHNPQLTAQ